MQKSPLLYYRMECEKGDSTNFQEVDYDFISGLWNINGQPLIKKYIENKGIEEKCQTLITETRESIDRSEGSCYDMQSLEIDKTTITATREGIDRSEQSVSENLSNEIMNFNNVGETLLTKTREGIYRSEGSMGNTNDETISLHQSLITFTRESIDRSEQS
ncbi:hypothetical protein CLTEP_26490 [Clostridium tepidiprofundi DSM 19306]|uniref:Uncharacterized protein n=1 Tax=Clostridium tepidiprofundi DSM 19306 TaxID=1121338 RepID=A0A151AS55_9CLOT|nr:hypothetical protein [Clostridium tepidiprofundi]KYH30456.1 hypothetical protein CLTEP_26490 [Clostridium tepidiprofundi DSM 19306]